MGEQYVFLALPRRPGFRPKGERQGHLKLVKPTFRGKFKAAKLSGSAFNMKCNHSWLAALSDRRTEGTTHYAMQHDDVEAPAGWADVLIDEMEAHGADLCAAVVPIKCPRGLTSTAIRNRETGETRRVTMTELHQLPETFGIDDLHAAGFGAGNKQDECILLNNGLWVCKLADWCERMPGWRIVEGIGLADDGTLQVYFLSEDWWFSDWLAQRGLKAIATRKVPVIHRGQPDGRKPGHEYRSDCVWGEWERDQGDPPMQRAAA